MCPCAQEYWLITISAWRVMDKFYQLDIGKGMVRRLGMNSNLYLFTTLQDGNKTSNRRSYLQGGRIHRDVSKVQAQDHEVAGHIYNMSRMT